jgi:hypothetical protein
VNQAGIEEEILAYTMCCLCDYYMPHCILLGMYFIVLVIYYFMFIVLGMFAFHCIVLC